MTKLHKTSFPAIVKKSLLPLFILIVIASCTDNTKELTKTGNLTITFQANGLAGGRTISLDGASYLFITIEDGKQNVVLDKKIPVIKLNGEYITETIPLTTGSYKLTRFLVLDKDDNAIYGTPVQGSRYAYLVDHSLPLSFDISIDKTTALPVEVISLKAYNAGDIGYLSFQIDRKCSITAVVNGQSLCIDKGSYLIAYASVKGQPSVFSLRTPFFANGEKMYNLAIETTEFTGPGTYTLKEYNGGPEYSTYGYFAVVDTKTKQMTEYESVSGTLMVESVKAIAGTSNGLATGTFTMTAKDDHGNTVTISGSFSKLRGMGWWD